MWLTGGIESEKKDNKKTCFYLGYISTSFLISSAGDGVTDDRL